MSLFVHRAVRADALVSGLADLLAVPLPDPFAQEVVAVPARGVERWVTQQLSLSLGRSDGRADGVCAAVSFPTPAAIVASASGLTDPHGIQLDPWSPDRLVWTVLDVLDEDVLGPGADPSWCPTLARHLGAGPDDGQGEWAGDERLGRRYSVARRLAGLFDRYALHRPEMLAAWAAGPPGTQPDSDGRGAALPVDLRWQSELWRRVRARVPGPDPVRRAADALARLRADPVSVDLPGRLSVFGVTRLPAAHIAVLSAVAVHRDVHLWLTHPSPTLWDALAGCAPGGPVRRRDDASVGLVRNPLLSSLGRDARELQVALAGVDTVDVPPAAVPDVPPTGTLLARLQHSLAGDRPPGGGAGTEPLDRGDRTVQVHACHGPARQVEVLREVLVGLLDDDASLQPRDIVVMCPDIEVYAPLIGAAFGMADVVDGGHPAHRLRVRLADRALRQTNPLLGLAGRLLTLAEGRMTASDLLDLAAAAPVRRRFRFDEDELDQIAEWVAQANVRWGVDAADRARYGLAAFGQNTWRTGLDRVLLGVGMADQDHRWLGLALPLDDVGSNDVDLAGRLAEMVDRAASARTELTGAHPLAHWLTVLGEAVESLGSVADADLWQVAELRRELAAVTQEAGDRAGRVVLRPADVRALLDRRLGGRPTRANFRTGTLTVCTMVPMRSVPHRVICLVGLDDGIFPRGAGVDGDDVLARDPVTGERDPRGEDRQLLLDALQAATDHVVITYTGADERTGAVLPPAVPVGEILDALDDLGSTADGRPVREQVLVRHPLQPFDRRNFLPGALGRPGPFSFDATAWAGAEAAAGERRAVADFLPRPLPARVAGDVELADVIDVLTHPARGFLRRRLDVLATADRGEPSDDWTVELDALERWAVGDRILRDRLAGVDEATCRQTEWRRGTLPPGPLGAGVLAGILNQVEPLVDGTALLRAEPRRTVDVSVTLDGGRELRGSVPDVYGDTVVSVGFSALSVKQRLRAWISLCALCAGRSGTAWTAVSVGRGSGGIPARSSLPTLDRATAERRLTELVELHDLMLTEPLPMALKTSAAYHAARARGIAEAEARRRAANAWAGDKFPGEDADPAHVRIWGPSAPFELLTLAPPSPLGASTGEPHRFAELAGRWFDGLFGAEQLGIL
ncbi:exodeoxyribonuclease V subunit gamma [Nakamurella flavida]|uniref:RecBCD enzyme subunit RecC n=1 Tax=Nakamurella flavida TaxID=363630 RepID=A0A939C0X6_9ACTN|nr:exodeoxyribonuclease V subunit gamma [Nakamurella flavida]MBM9477163.1 exodeoxyribonuclease V subunit gamma [Nakamurella flavida]MDP9780112.1 exodeoxyribonuclease V gamma subunit [Nakamurella flavida]